MIMRWHPCLVEPKYTIPHILHLLEQLVDESQRNSGLVTELHPSHISVNDVTQKVDSHFI